MVPSTSRGRTKKTKKNKRQTIYFVYFKIKWRWMRRRKRKKVTVVAEKRFFIVTVHLLLYQRAFELISPLYEMRRLHQPLHPNYLSLSLQRQRLLLSGSAKVSHFRPPGQTGSSLQDMCPGLSCRFTPTTWLVIGIKVLMCWCSALGGPETTRGWQ